MERQRQGIKKRMLRGKSKKVRRMIGRDGGTKGDGMDKNGGRKENREVRREKPSREGRMR